MLTRSQKLEKHFEQLVRQYDVNDFCLYNLESLDRLRWVLIQYMRKSDHDLPNQGIVSIIRMLSNFKTGAPEGDPDLHKLFTYLLDEDLITELDHLLKVKKGVIR